MKIIIRLVGYSEIINDEKYIYEYSFTTNTIFNFETLKMMFEKGGNPTEIAEKNQITLVRFDFDGDACRAHQLTPFIQT